MDAELVLPFLVDGVAELCPARGEALCGCNRGTNQRQESENEEGERACGSHGGTFSVKDCIVAGRAIAAFGSAALEKPRIHRMFVE